MWLLRRTNSRDCGNLFYDASLPIVIEGRGLQKHDKKIQKSVIILYLLASCLCWLSQWLSCWQRVGRSADRQCEHYMEGEDVAAGSPWLEGRADTERTQTSVTCLFLLINIMCVTCLLVCIWLWIRVPVDERIHCAISLLSVYLWNEVSWKFLSLQVRKLASQTPELGFHRFGKCVPSLVCFSPFSRPPFPA